MNVIKLLDECNNMTKLVCHIKCPLLDHAVFWLTNNRNHGHINSGMNAITSTCLKILVHFSA